MCDLEEKWTATRKVEGFKVVEERDYSPFTLGFCYGDHRIGIWRKSCAIYKDAMNGRTTSYKGARALLEYFRDISGYHNAKDIKIKRAYVSRSLMCGTYGDSPVVAGRKIKIMEEVKEVDRCVN